MFPRLLVAIVLIVVFGFSQAHAQTQQPQKYEPAGLSAPPPQPDLFDVSVGFNYIYLADQFPETKNLYGVSASAFINATSWLAAGGEFMADFGSHNVPHVPFFFGGVDIDSQRYIFVFGPRVTIWQNPKFRVFAEALGGGVHAEAQLTASSRFTTRTASASDDGLAAAIGAGFDWRFTEHLSWRVVQADYLPTHLGSQWQNNFRASTGISYSFGQR